MEKFFKKPFSVWLISKAMIYFWIQNPWKYTQKHTLSHFVSYRIIIWSYRATPTFTCHIIVHLFHLNQSVNIYSLNIYIQSFELGFGNILTLILSEQIQLSTKINFYRYKKASVFSLRSNRGFFIFKAPEDREDNQSFQAPLWRPQRSAAWERHFHHARTPQSRQSNRASALSYGGSLHACLRQEK